MTGSGGIRNCDGDSDWFGDPGWEVEPAKLGVALPVRVARCEPVGGRCVCATELRWASARVETGSGGIRKRGISMKSRTRLNE